MWLLAAPSDPKAPLPHPQPLLSPVIHETYPLPVRIDASL